MRKSTKLWPFAVAAACLLAAPVAQATDPRFVSEDFGGDATVIDNQTDLEWQRAPDNLGGHPWVDALGHCDTLDFGGHTDWRLPNVMELSSIVDELRSTPPAVNGTFFEETSFNFNQFWTSTTDPKNSINAYVLQFHEAPDVYDGGGVRTLAKTGNRLALCVRSHP
jgi:hypothetical protein